MSKPDKYRQAMEAFDEANSRDPNTTTEEGNEIPGELLYARRMTEWLNRLDPDAPEVLRLAARCQHIERWVIPRKDYPMTRPGYLKWRNDLKKYHAERAGEILLEAGYESGMIRRVQDLVLKKGIKTDPGAQMLEDVICLVFLNWYFEEFARKHNEEKLIRILQKTWRKMSERGREEALTLDLPGHLEALVKKALDRDS